MNNNESSWPLFTYTISGNEPIYKGMNKKTFDNKYQDPCWFTENIETAKRYGKYVHCIKTGTEIKLLNLTSGFFHIFLKDTLNLRYRGTNNDGNDIRKFQLLLPLGFPDYNIQKSYIQAHVPEDSLLPNCENERTNIEPSLSIFDHHHRYSNLKFDVKLVNTLSQIFGSNFDGYIAPIDWPSCFHNGFFHNEICFFKPAELFDKKKLFYFNLPYTNQAMGGSKNRQNTMRKYDIDEDDQRKMGTMDVYPKDVKEYNELMEQDPVFQDYGGPRRFDERGKLLIPTWEEAMADEKRKKELRFQESIKDSGPLD